MPTRFGAPASLSQRALPLRPAGAAQPAAPSPLLRPAPLRAAPLPAAAPAPVPALATEAHDGR